MRPIDADIWRALPAMAENVPVAQVPAILILIASAQAASHRHTGRAALSYDGLT